MSDTTWLPSEAIELCAMIEAVAPTYGCHVALTGGLLYKDGARKDADILFYKIRQAEKVDRDGLFAAMADFGVVRRDFYGWLEKGEWHGKPIDFFFPETPSREGYPNTEAAADAAFAADDDGFLF